MAHGDPDPYNQIQILDDLSFEKFKSMKAKWLSTVNF